MPRAQQGSEPPSDGLSSKGEKEVNERRNNDYLWVLIIGVGTLVMIAIGWIRSH